MLAKQEVEELIKAIRDGVKAANGTLPAEGIAVTVSVRNSEEGALDSASFQVVVTEQADRVELQQDQIAAVVEMNSEVDRAETAFDRLRAARRRDDEPLRGTGRTSGGILQAIADALFAPGRWVEFKDHAGYSTPGLADAVSRMVKQLNLRIAVVTTRRHGDNSRHILVQSNPWSRVRLQRGQVLRVVNPDHDVQMHSVVSVHPE